MYSSIEQDMLSNKKLEDLAGDKNIPLSESAQIQSANLSKVTDMLYGQDTTIGEMIKGWQDVGFIGAEGIGNQFTLDAMLKIKEFFL